MALPPLATVDDLEDWIGSPVGNTARAEAILSAASTLIRTHTGRLWVDADGNPEAGIAPVKAQAAAEVAVMVAERVYNNPKGITQETAGPFSRSVAAWAALGMALTAAELSMLGGSIPGSGIPGLSSVRVVAPAAASGSRLHHPWWTDDEETA